MERKGWCPAERYRSPPRIHARVALSVAHTTRTARNRPFEDVVYDEPQSDRPIELSQQEHEQFVDALYKAPKEVGTNAAAWSVLTASNYLSEEFGIDYCDRHVRRLMTRTERS